MAYVRKNTASAKAKPKASDLPVSYSADDVTGKIKVVLCGKPKNGKTHFALTFPAPFFVDADHGLATANRLKKNVPTWRLDRTKWDTNEQGYLSLHGFFDQLVDAEGPWHDFMVEHKIETIVLDSASALSELMEVEIVKYPPFNRKADDGKEALTLPDYNIIQRRMTGLIDKGRTVPYNFVVITGIDSIQDDMGRMVEIPLMTGRKLGGMIPHMFDEVYLCGYDDDKAKYFISPLPTKRFEHPGSRWGVKAEKHFDPSFDSVLGKFYKK